MQRTTINPDTNSLYTIEEKTFLEKNGFSWSNKSYNSYHEGDNCLYRYKDSYQQDICISTNEFTLDTYMPTHLEIKHIKYKTNNFNDLIDHFALSFKDKFLLNIYYINSLIFGFFYFILLLSIYIFNKNTISQKNSILKSRFKDIISGNYHFLDDARPFIWGFNLFIVGILITYLLVS